MLPVYQERRQLNRNYALLMAGMVFLFFGFLFYQFGGQIGASIALLPALLVYRITTNKYRKRQRWFKQEFPKEWLTIIESKVAFYHELTKDEQDEFLARCYVFIHEKRIIGVETDIDDTVRLMVAASAMIPVMAFDEFEYDQVREVLIYPALFDENYQFKKEKTKGANISGMVGNGPMKGVVIFSKPDLLKAYDGRPHKFNVGIHEFTHLIDGADGAIDGIPASIMDKAYILPWLSLMKKEMKRIKHRKSDINPYALTNEQEFLSVVSEYFFNSPKKFRKNHPELFGMMQGMYQTDEVTQHISVLKELVTFKSV